MLTQAEPISPVTLYLDNLAPSGRRSMRSMLQSAVEILGFHDPVETVPWQKLAYQHMAQVRNQLKPELAKSRLVIF